MNLLMYARRLLIPGPVVSLWCLYRFGARVSHRAEVDLSPTLEIGRGAQISSFCKIKATGPLRIGANTHIATGCFLGAGFRGLHIGDDCLIGPNCSITTSEYRYDKLDVPMRLQGYTSKGTRIGRNVFIGSNSVILDGSDIGDNVIIGAGSLVSGAVAAGSIISGNPAKVVFRRR